MSPTASSRAGVVTRIAPSPTGHLHIGTARTALFNYLFTRHHSGKIILRSEDTDRERSRREYEDEIREGLEWLGIEHDVFYRQSEHAPRHQELLEKTVAEGKAYVSKEPGTKNPNEMVEVVRLKSPGREITFHDEIRGDITFDTTELGDFVIARAIHDPLYHFAVVADDWDDGITHVIRGEDHISNTQRQILIQEALGAPRPIYAHLPLILDTDRSKLSKRKGHTALLEYRDEGFLPEALINYLALLGWHPENDVEHLSLPELVTAFDLARVQKSGAVWDREKLLSVNQRWMRGLSDEEFIKRGNLSAEALKAVSLLKERAHTFSEAKTLIAGELACLFGEPTLSRDVLVAKELAEQPRATQKYLTELTTLIAALPDGARPEAIKDALMPYAEHEGRGAVLWPLRYALSGQERSPDPFTLISILGREEALARMEIALDILKG